MLLANRPHLCPKCDAMSPGFMTSAVSIFLALITREKPNAAAVPWTVPQGRQDPRTTGTRSVYAGTVSVLLENGNGISASPWLEQGITYFDRSVV